MERKRCFCNDTRGTDCEWCGGSGWIVEQVRIDITPSVLKKSISVSSPKSKGRIFYISKNKMVEVVKTIPQSFSKKQTLENRIKRLVLEISSIDFKLTEESVQYIKKIFSKIENELNNKLNQDSKKKRGHYHRLKSDIVNLKTLMLNKFALYQELPPMDNIQPKSDLFQ